MIRKATKADAASIAPMIMVILEDMELDVFKTLSREQVIELLIAGIQTEDYRYSYNHGHVWEKNGEIAGIVFGYPGAIEPLIDAPLTEIIQEKGFDTSIQLFTEPETFPNEWYLDSIVTKESFRGQGVGTELLAALPDFALEDGQKVIGLNCDQQNPQAQKLYERMGFKKNGEVTISGHLYNHMQKEITKK
ncbi:GNAT family N-acetyltransferase [Carnobacterium divergens]|uniref:GNAT family N-acetyltransferase n=1 Tax=Carnobacterium divergens TaxID=2748 RepID=A0AAW8R5Z2_CARDV|nr:GNAT family N-acetyltransferase [Carnobacterium divergens]MDT1957055.1 GNAT family N-acetyltransferase [Carnobacterium divergens]MDT1973025.1 GNAT family N-acetyltransferase [Carnobacterium divergens]TFJ40716.1 GNAT family N-acetyltransferase [Carnobacterium divergens]TFJ49404.1 GNAT family N-acetyltransferase [Carnobacterium divergens]TFJ54771.1 GNAT family N-acetyltransferase [Carnobacterium divergens]